MKIKLFFLFLTFVPYCVKSQKLTSTSTITLEEVQINSIKISSKKKEVPLSISKLNFKKTQKIFQQLSLQEYLEGVPGLFSLNSNNYAQDLRISIRGFGARSAFGIRGINIVVDGIPETTPDGQGQIDNVPLGLIENIEIIRGPSASLYGNAAGGVIVINTIDSTSKDTYNFKYSLGSYSLNKYQFLSSLNKKNTNVIIYLNRTEANGFRDHSSLKQNILNIKLKHKASNSSVINFQFNYTNSPLAQDSGGLTIEEVMSNRNQARQRNIDYDTYEKINQLKLGLSLDKKLNSKIDFSIYGFFANRFFYGKLPFENGGIVDLDRFYSGFGTRFTYKSSNPYVTNKVLFGIESSFQNDYRKRYKNIKGIEGDKVFDQKEIFNNIGIYLVDEIKINRFIILSSLRFDNLQISTDKVMFDKRYNVFNPSIAMNYDLKNNQYLFMNFSTSFETPTMSELSVNPSGDEGFNINLNPSKAQNYEVGWKLYKPKFLFEATAFYINSTNEVLPYELEEFPGRSFYKNAGSNLRRGFEVFAQLNWNVFKFTGSYNFAKYTFEYNEDNQESKLLSLPGIPKSHLYLNIEFINENNWITRLTFENIGGLYANSSNTVYVNSFQKTSFQIGKSFVLNAFNIELLGGINNILNYEYFDNIRLNAFGSRFYEPAPPRNIYTGISLNF